MNYSTHRLSLNISRVRVMATYKMYCLYASMHIRLSASCCTCLSCLALRCSDCCHSCPPRHLRSLFSSSYQYGRRALLRGRPAVVGTPVSGLLQKSVDSCRGLWTPAVVGTPVSGLHCGLLMMMNAFHNHINPFLCSIIVIGSESFKKAL